MYGVIERPATVREHLLYTSDITFVVVVWFGFSLFSHIANSHSLILHINISLAITGSFQYEKTEGRSPKTQKPQMMFQNLNSGFQ